MTSRLARILLVATLALVAVEWLASARAYRSKISDADWRETIDRLEPDLPVYLATDWLGPIARMESARVAELDDLARPDLRGVPRFHVLGVSGDSWSAALQTDLEDLPAPTLEDSVTIGGLELSTYILASPPIQDDLLADPARLQVGTGDRACSRTGSRWKCGKGREAVGDIVLGTEEIDYRARTCLAVDANDGEQFRIRIDDFSFGDVVHGHVGFGGFNERLRSDGMVTVSLAADGQVLGRWTFTDDQGWAPFAVATPAGQGRIELIIQPSVRGTWGRTGYSAGRGHRACIELRSFEEGGA